MKRTEYKEAMKTPYNRIELINLIYVYSGDEFKNIEDVWDLAKETDSQLAGRVQDIYAYCNSFDNWVITIRATTKHKMQRINDFKDHYQNLLSYEENLKNFEKYLVG